MAESQVVRGVMDLFAAEHETINGSGWALRRRELSCAALLDRCLARIEEWEPRVRAWVVVDRDGARAQARALDAELAAGRCRGPLHGIPFGIKDIIDVAGLPTAAGFAPWANRVAERDAGLVAILREAGAVILGKTVTTQFAWIDPPLTRNPWDLERTPGGSSSGSAAAVATGMCLGALGTQTGGSIIRPASFCGVAGLKPTFSGRFDGILPFAPHLDHPGPIARTVLDLGLVFREFLGLEPVGDHGWSAEQIDEELARNLSPLSRPPRLGRLRGAFQRGAEGPMLEALDRAVSAFKEAGAEVVDLADPFDFDEVIRNHRTIMAAEAAAGHADRYRDQSGEYKSRIRALIEEGCALSASGYIAARTHQEALRSALARRAGDRIDAFLMPATLGPAPDPSTTGDPRFNAPWSYTGSPVISFPIGLSAEGLPLALQLIEPRPLREFELIAAARWCENIVRRAGRPERE